MSTCRGLWGLRGALAGILVTTFVAVPPAAAQPGLAPVDDALTSIMTVPREQHVRVIVRVRPDRREPVTAAVRKAGHTLHRAHTLVSALTVELPARAVPALSRQPGVESISLDAPVTSQQATGMPSPVGPQTSALQQTLGVTAAAARTGGRGVGVAIIDSGIAPSPDFGNRIRGFYDFTHGGVATAPFDDHGHGTHVAGLVGGSGRLSDGAYAGVAPQVDLIGLKVLDASGTGYTSDVISAIEFAVRYKAVLGIDIINLSLGHPPYESAATDPLVQAVQQAAAAGVVVVVAAGNVGVKASTGAPAYSGVL